MEKQTKRGLIKLLEDGGYTASRSEARRLISQGHISVNGEVVTESAIMVNPNEINKISIGKKTFLYPPEVIG